MDKGSFGRASNNSDMIWLKDLTVSVWLLCREETEKSNEQKWENLEDIPGKDDVLDRIIELWLWEEIIFGI